MSVLAALLLATTASESPLVSEFESVCIRPTTAEAVETALISRGWQSFSPEPASLLGKQIEKGRELMTSVGAEMDFRNFWRLLDGRRVELTLTAMPIPTADNRVMVGCNIYDFEAPSPSSERLLSKLAGSDAAERMERDDARFLTWRGVWGPHSTLRAGYIPVGGGAEAAMGFSGESLVASFFEGSR